MPRQQRLGDIAQAQIEAEVVPHSTGHHFDRMAVALVGRCTHGHWARCYLKFPDRSINVTPTSLDILS
ncbi:hypothetical protein [Mesorhizobium sp. M0254]|uniref:hypothetical protein n=1 Tax=Mesorhizobium sp. M0254 TaxID=2956927 RepID=UPI003335A97C